MDFNSFWLPLLVCLKAVALSGSERTITNLIYYPYIPSTWNVAQDVCTQNGGALLEISDQAMYDFYQDFKSKVTWKLFGTQNVNTNVWTGLVMGDSVNGSYLWAKSCQPLDDALSHFYTRPVTGTNKFCVSDSMIGDDGWTQRYCNEQYAFVCMEQTVWRGAYDALYSEDARNRSENGFRVRVKNLDDLPCDYETKEDTDLQIRGGRILWLWGYSFPYCLEVCMSMSNCWLFTMNDERTCSLLSHNVSDFLNTDNYASRPGNNVTLIQCYKDHIIWHAVAEFNGSDAFPTSSCSLNLSMSLYVTSSLPITEVTSDVTSLPITEVTPDVTSLPITEVTPDVTSLSITDVTPDVTPLPIAEVTPDVTSLPITEVTPDVTSLTTTTKQHSTFVKSESVSLGEGISDPTPLTATATPRSLPKTDGDRNASTTQNITPRMRPLTHTTQLSLLVTTLVSTYSTTEKLRTPGELSTTPQRKSTQTRIDDDRITRTSVFTSEQTSTTTQTTISGIELISITEDLQASSSPVVTSRINSIKQDKTRSRINPHQPAGMMKDSRLTRKIAGINGNCNCECLSPNPNLTEFMDSLLQNLTHNSTHFSSHRRKYISVEDKRPSAKNVGIISAVLLVTALGSIVLLDLTAMGRDLTILKQNILLALGKRPK